jgi:hypothetical protein
MVIGGENRMCGGDKRATSGTAWVDFFSPLKESSLVTSRS